jgi:hypothetical protein
VWSGSTKTVFTNADGRTGDDPEQALDGWGRQGWELAGTLDHVSGGGRAIFQPNHHLILKRERH